MIDVIGTRAGRESLATLARIIEECKDEDPFRPVFVVAPSREAARSVRQALALAAPKGFVNVLFGTSFRLASLLAEKASCWRGKELLDDTTSRWLARSAVQEVARAKKKADPEMSADGWLDVFSLPQTADALVDSFRRLDESTTTQEITSVLGTKGPRSLPSDTELILEAYLTYKERCSERYRSPADAFSVAVSALAEGAVKDGPLPIWYLPMGLTYSEEQLVAALTSVGPQYIVAGFTGDTDADCYLRALVERIAGADGTRKLDTYSPTRNSDEKHPDPLVCTALDADEEVRSALRIAQKWVKEGTDPSRIALAYTSAIPYETIFFELLEEGGIEFWGLNRTRLLDTEAGAVLRCLVDVLDSGFRRDTVVALAHAIPPGARRIKVGESTFEISPEALDELSRELGIRSGIDAWLDLLDEASRLHGCTSNRTPRSEAARSARAFIDLIRSSLSADLLKACLVGDADPAVEPEISWAEAGNSMGRLLRALLASSKRKDKTRDGDEDFERSSLDRVVSSLSSLRRLDSIVGPTRFEDFVAEVFHLLEAVPEEGGGQKGICVGQVNDLAGAAIEAVFIAGATANCFLAPPREDSLLRPLAEALKRPEISRIGPSVMEQRLRLYTLLGTAERSVVSHPLLDLRKARSAHCSWWVLEEANSNRNTRRAGPSSDASTEEERSHLLRNQDLASRSWGDWHIYVPSLETGLFELGPADDQEADLCQILRQLDAGVPFLETSVVACEQALQRRALRRSALVSPDIDEWWGLVQPSVEIPNIATITPTSLEHWAQCPYRFFLGRILSVSTLEKPEELTEPPAKTLGSAIHDILCRLFEDALQQGAAWPLDERLTRLYSIFEEVINDQFSERSTGKAFPSLEVAKPRLLKALTNAVLVENLLEQKYGFQPRKLEHSFDTTISLRKNKAEIHVRGRADRIDRSADGSAIAIIDYKTGRLSQARSKQLQQSLFRLMEVSDSSEFEPEGSAELEMPEIGRVEISELVAGGRFLQIPIYMVCVQRLDAAEEGFDLRSMIGIIWHIDVHSTKNTVFAASIGVSDLPSIESFLTEMIDRVRNGVFVPNPGAVAYNAPGENCLRCDFDRVCPQDRSRIWALKSHDPVFLDYALLTGQIEEQ